MVAMTSIPIVCLFLFAIISPLRAVDTDRPEYIQCQSNSECGPGHCCSIGPMRYSTPQCKAMQAEGEMCRPNNTPRLNMTVGYPDGALINLTDVYYILCPCADGLSCDVKDGTCKDIGKKSEMNRLYDENNKQND